MDKFLKLFDDNFAYISVNTLLSTIIALLLSSIGVNAYIIVTIFIATIIYYKVFIHKQKEKETIKQSEPTTNNHYATFDAEFNITCFNKEFLAEHISQNRTLLGKNLFDILHISPQNILKTVKEHGNFKGVVESTKNNKLSYHSLIIEPTIEDSKKEFFVISHDVTNSLMHDKKLKEQFLVDKLTGLATKTKLLDDVEESKYSCTASTLIYINIDSFDEVNEFFGLDAGSKIISHVASWLEDRLPSVDSKLYKLDINNFAILSAKKLTLLNLQEYLKKISIEIEKKNFYFKNTALNISFTLGAAYNKADLVKCTYLALKDAQNLKKPYKIYNKSCNHETRFLENIKMTQIIKDAITENRVIPFFQPIYNLKTNKIEKFESLIRIQSRNNVILKPNEFLDIAKKSKLYLSLSKSMIKSSFEKLESLKFPITINISIEDILDKKVSNFILRRLNHAQNGHLITFEIVESQEIKSHIKVVNFIKKVKSLGCKIAIDDFGSGYSNFEQLLKLDIDYLKIDASLIKNIDTNRDCEIMTKSIISFAKEMGLKTIAEFVSTQDVFDKVKLLGVDYVQGYYIGKPSNLQGD